MNRIFYSVLVLVKDGGRRFGGIGCSECGIEGIISGGGRLFDGLL